VTLEEQIALLVDEARRLQELMAGQLRALQTKVSEQEARITALEQGRSPGG
jgi:hypothetical protein